MGKSEMLKELEEECRKADMPLKEGATNLVFGKGKADVEIVFIGEAPGHNEDIQGMPFVGRAGKNLDKLLHKVGLSLDDVYIANISKFFPAVPTKGIP